MKFSIITCTYKSKRFLSKNIRSVFSQSCREYEHIFIDGYSRDGTVEIIKEYQEKYPGQVSLYQLPPKGISNAMNEGVRRAKGDFLIHLHSDDSFYDQDVLTDVAHFLETKDHLDWIYGKINVIEEDGRSVGVFPDRWIFQHDSGSYFGRYMLKFFNYIPHQAVFIKKSVFERFGYFDETLDSVMDPDMWLRIRNKTDWRFMDRVICNYMVRPGAKSSSLANQDAVMRNMELVQRRYMNPVEFSVARLCNTMLKTYNKSFR